MSAPGISSGRPATNSASQAEFVMGNGSEGAPGTTAQEKVNVWSIGRRQLVAMLIGALLFAALFFLSDTFELIYFASIASIANIALAGTSRITGGMRIRLLKDLERGSKAFIDIARTF